MMNEITKKIDLNEKINIRIKDVSDIDVLKIDQKKKMIDVFILIKSLIIELNQYRLSEGLEKNIFIKIENLVDQINMILIAKNKKAVFHEESKSKIKAYDIHNIVSKDTSDDRSVNHDQTKSLDMMINKLSLNYCGSNQILNDKNSHLKERFMQKDIIEKKDSASSSEFEDYDRNSDNYNNYVSDENDYESSEN